ncbi:GT4 family glycosyltransferase PelF [Desulfonatronum parangueonense]
MRVMQVIYAFNVGGSESVARDIALKLNTNVEHAVASLEYDGHFREVFDTNNVRTYVIDRKPTEFLGPMLRIWNAMRSFKPHVVHTHHLYQLFYSWPGALLCGARLIHTEHEYYSLLPEKYRSRLHRISRFCNAVTGVNKETSDFLVQKVKISKSKVHTIVNGIDLQKFKNSSCNREQFGIAADDLVAGIVARLHPVKDHSMLLHAFRTVVDKLPKAKLLIVGDGAERENLEKQRDALGLEHNVKFLGTRSDIPNILSCIDLFVLASWKEGLPLSILEAMAAGKPVVATDVGGVPSVVNNSNSGIIVPHRNPEAMAEAILQMLFNKNNMERYGSAGRRYVEDNYSLDKSISKYASLYMNS